MTKWITYGELADQYEQSAQLIHDLIHKRTKQLHAATGEEAYRIKQQITELYQMRREALETATKLRQYSAKKEVTE